jgi:thymidylate synthase
MHPIHIKGTSISDTWFQLLWELIDGYENDKPGIHSYQITAGSYTGQRRIEFDFITAEITQPWIKPYVPEMPADLNLPPLADGEDPITSYLPYLACPDKQPGETYTYGERLCVSWQKIIETYKKSGYNTNICVFEVARPEDIFLIDTEKNSSSHTPCLRLVQPRIYNNVMSWIIYFRSWDLWGGFPINLGGLQTMKEAMIEEISDPNLKDGPVIAISPGLHIYDHVELLAYARLRRTKREKGEL